MYPPKAVLTIDSVVRLASGKKIILTPEVVSKMNITECEGIDMEYQLTLKFPYFDVDDYKNIVALEDKLIKKLGRSAHVEGHYAGSEVMNIFVITGQPLESFVVVLEVVRGEGLLASLSVLCRAVNGSKYARLWPLNLQESVSVQQDF